MNFEDLQSRLETPEAHFTDGFLFKELAKRLECSDGTTLSVQASEFHYCTPRTNFGPWIEVEVGFPSKEPDESWAEHFDGDWENDDRCGSVYGYVPVDKVLDFINSHGGVTT